MTFQLFFLRRLLFTLPLLLGITVVAFMIANAVPADPVTANLPQNALNDERMVQAFREKWGLDEPLYVQYWTYLTNILRGDMGTSIRTRQPIIEDIGRHLPATLELATLALIIGITMGISFGVVSAVWRNSIIDYLMRVFALMGVSFPVFLLALIALNIFYGQLGWVAGPGRLSIGVVPPPPVTNLYLIDSLLAGQVDTMRNAFSHIILPAFVLGSFVSAMIARITRSAMLEVIDQDYIRTAYAKGLSAVTVIRRHALSNAMIPVVTVIGLSYGSLLAGAVLTESIFAWPGIGRYMFRASVSQDFPAIMGVSMIIALIYVIVNLIVDMLYFVLDPRIRTSG
jgi:peptide/nickel transport system permease protein